MKPFCMTNIVTFAAGSLGLSIGLSWLWKRRRCQEYRQAFKGSSLLSVNDLSTDHVLYILKLAKHFKVVRDAQQGKSKCRFANWFYRLFGRQPSHPFTVGLLFMEPSTRTRCSFEIAAKRLGCSTVSVCEGSSSSAAKGEKILDTARMLQGYCDALVIRHPEKGVVARLHNKLPSTFPLFNAGDGEGEHPSQALLDLFAMEQEFPGRLNNWKDKALTVTLIGDLAHGRTVHSLAKLLMRFNTRVQFLAPDGFGFPPEILNELDRIAASSESLSSRYLEVSTLTEALRLSDVIYCTRLQKERIHDSSLPKSFSKDFILTSDLLDMHSPEHQIVLHPLPRLNEIDTSVDTNPRQRYFRQAADGIFIRMALLSLALGI